nr:hypothetical protein Ade03nite_78800 [Actinoplanes derwentensis]
MNTTYDDAAPRDRAGHTEAGMSRSSAASEPANVSRLVTAAAGETAASVSLTALWRRLSAGSEVAIT